MEDKIASVLGAFKEVRKVRDAHPSTLLMGTEACEGYLPFAAGPSLGDWGRGETYGHDILQDLLAGANGWVDWNLVLGALPACSSHRKYSFPHTLNDLHL